MLTDGRHFDAVILGWASLSHVHDGHELQGLFAAVRKIAPRAPILFSFMAGDDNDLDGRLGDLRRWVRKTLTPEAPQDAVRTFLPWAGFITLHREHELRQIVERAGYRVGFFSRAECSHAVCVPAERA
jgi:hypothetical protein